MAPAQASLLLLRHGIAEERRPGRPDHGRALTAAGRRRTEAVLEKLVALGLGVERLVASPLLRARQTAEIAVAAGLAPALELATSLEPGGDVFPLLAAWMAPATAAGSDPRPRRLALVGHEPDLGNLAARLIGAPAGSISLRKAGLALLEPEACPDAVPPAGAEAGAGREAAAIPPALGIWRLRLLLTPRSLLS